MSQIMTEHITIRSAVPENMAKKYFMQICIDKKEILKMLRNQKSRISIAILAQASASARAWW